MKRLNLQEGKKLIELARATIYNKEIDLKGLDEKRGVFVTLYTYPSKKLRGCIGFPEPIYTLGEAVVGAAKAAAFEDPRFEPLGDENIIIEISVLTLPKRLEGGAEKYLMNIEIGSDGLMVEYERQKGLLLPQVFLDYDVDVEEALAMTCQKAGLPSETWLEKNCKVYKFQSQIFAEDQPEGKVKVI